MSTLPVILHSKYTPGVHLHSLVLDHDMQGQNDVCVKEQDGDCWGTCLKLKHLLLSHALSNLIASGLSWVHFIFFFPSDRPGRSRTINDNAARFLLAAVYEFAPLR